MLNNNTCTLCYPLCLQGNNHTSSYPKSLDTNKTQTAVLLWFYFGCLFLNVYKDAHFHFLNVLKATVTSMLSWVSITSPALLQTLSPFSSSPLRGNKQWLAGIWSPGSDMEWMAAIAGTKQTRQSRTMADRERTENVTTGSRRGTFFPLLNIIILCSTCTLKGNSPGSSFMWNLANLATSQIHCCVFEVNASH